MRVLRGLLLLGLAFVAVQAWAFDDGESLARWIGYYYQAPQPERLGEAVRAFTSEPERLAKPERLDATAHFFAVVARSDTRAMSELSSLSKTLSDAAAKQFVERVLRDPGRLEFAQARDPNELDITWAHFSATGKLETVRLVMKALDFQEPDVDLKRPFWAAIAVKDRPEAARIMRSAAAWSLSKHAQSHPVVRKSLEAELLREPLESRRQRLRDILDGRISLR